MRLCIGCEQPFDPRNPQQRRCRPGCGYTRPAAPRASRAKTPQPTEFIAVDGEGITLPDGTHKYVLLSIGDKSINGERLGLLDVFRFLWDQRVMYPDAAFVGFYLSYDFSQWFRDLPEERARMLFTDAGRMARMPKSDTNPVPYPVRWRGWEFDLLGLRRLKLRPDNNSEAPWLYVCDAGPFWQTSFISAIDPKNWAHPIVSQSEFDIIVRGKAHRSDAVYDDAMKQYNVTENNALQQAMGILDSGFKDQGWNLRKSQWFGPGQVAEKWLKSIDAPKGHDIAEVTPGPVLAAGVAAYYGGWFEIPCHGLIPGDSYEYDINSAYPDVISKLPCLLHGRWVSGVHPGRLTLVHCLTFGDDPYLGGLPHRNAQGIISRPRSTSGWYWMHEIDAAKRAGLIEAISVYDAWSYIPCDCPPPLASIADLYNQRLAIGKNTAHGKALKLVYNSAYGKFCQSIGNPKYANPIYASLITAGCRTRILDAIATHPDRSRAVLMVATDGIYFRTQHPTLPLSPDTLGAWDAGTKQNLSLFMPGVYWDDKSRTNVNATSSQLKSRGINGVELARHIDIVDEQWHNFDGQWPSIEIPVRFSVVSPQLALARNDWASCGKVVTFEHDGATKTLSSNPSNKRRTDAVYTDDSVLRTHPYDSFGPSVPYSKRFGLDLESLIDNDEHLTDDGTINREIIEMLGID